MRVIAGERKGHKLLSPRDYVPSRPTEDRIKEAIFSSLYPIKINSNVLDLFSGTGQIGIEFLSRGAGFVYFCDNNRNNIIDLKENLNKTRYTEKAKIFLGDFRQGINIVSDKIDYIYLDPPYDSDYIIESIEEILKLDILNEDGIIIVETSKDIDFSKYDDLELEKEKDYKKKRIYYLRRI